MTARTFFVVLAVVGGSDAVAGTFFTLDFEGLGTNDPVLEFYNGGTSGQGFSGTDYGVSFSAQALGLFNANFDNNPSGITILYFDDGLGFTMNVDVGFTDSFSTWYVNGDPIVGSIEVFDGLDGTGNLLGQFDLPQNEFENDFNDWELVELTFDGMARSVRIEGLEDFIGFDDMTFGLIPAPTTLALLGLAAVMPRRRR